MTSATSPRVLRLRRDDRCAGCGIDLPAGIRAQWDQTRRVTTCLLCVERAAGAQHSASTDERDTGAAAQTMPADGPTEPSGTVRATVGSVPGPVGVAPTAGAPPTADAATPEVDPEMIAEPAPVSIDVIATLADEDGVAGASARREYERRRDKREEKVRTHHPKLGGLILALSDEPQSTTAWAKGAVGERKLGEALDALRSEGMVVLHDRRIPKSISNIDHLVIAPSGVHVIDAKRYKGKVEIRGSGSILRPGPNLLFVGGRNQTELVEAMASQVEVVGAAIADIAWTAEAEGLIRPRLCFVDAEWGWFAKPETLHGVRIGSPKSLLREIREPGPMTPDHIHLIATHLRAVLKPA